MKAQLNMRFPEDLIQRIRVESARNRIPVQELGRLVFVEWFDSFTVAERAAHYQHAKAKPAIMGRPLKVKEAA